MKKNTDQTPGLLTNFTRYLLLISGTIFLILGVIGIIIPLLPTTPFLLLAVACYAKSSKKAYHWLMHNKYFGSYIKNYHEGKGITLNAKIITITILWSTILFSIIFIIDIFCPGLGNLPGQIATQGFFRVGSHVIQ